MNSGLTRYRSAPSSYFSNMINNNTYEEDQELDPFFKMTSPETEQILSGFISGGHAVHNNNVTSQQHNQNEVTPNEFMVSMYQNHVHNNNSVVSTSASCSTVPDRLMTMNPSTNLLRQSSSPAGFFEHNKFDNGYHMMKSVNGFQPANRLKSPNALSSGLRSSTRLLSRIPEHEGKTMIQNNGGYVASTSNGSWDESSLLTDRFLKEYVENESSENQNDEGRIQSMHAASTGLTHQLSLPTSSTELSAMENLPRDHDNVPLRSRAKRGCATHPRSIAERVRRTRISERMRKLQDLVPNMDNQTSTAEMLDLAVNYIKELQNQVETLSDRRTKCTCESKLKL
ncbi:hypothetical protein QVD17_36414 [Tagetes erecta]|uniref:BHLH domain-containing protein n=1 Tax=Tagetes erecta TaxID=13708 RepID=A0AAD8JYJ1_TARER|nr:hypothetical protein QVD17_36414 [Tagetes erecta]